MNSYLLMDDKGMPKEEVSASEFAELKSEVKHQGDDIAEIKANTKNTDHAVQAINISLSKLTTIAEQNSKLEPRVSDLEKRNQSMNTKIAGAAGAIAAISFLIANFDKIKGLFS